MDLINAWGLWELNILKTFQHKQLTEAALNYSIQLTGLQWLRQWALVSEGGCEGPGGTGWEGAAQVWVPATRFWKLTFSTNHIMKSSACHQSVEASGSSVKQAFGEVLEWGVTIF